MRAALLPVLLALLLGPVASGQDIRGELYPPRPSVAQGKAKTEVTAALAPTEKPSVVSLQIKLVIPEGSNTYSMDPDLPKPTKVLLTLPAGWAEVDPGYTSDPLPKKSFDEVFGKEMEKFYGTVIFSRRFALPAGTNPAAARLTGKISFLVCTDDNCVPQSAPFEASFVPQGLKKAPAVSQSVAPAEIPLYFTAAEAPAAEPAGQVAPLSTAYEVTPKRLRQKVETPDPVRLQFELSPENAQPGDTVTLAITMTIADNWSTYGLTKADENQTETPTSIKFQTENLKAVGPITSVPEPELHTTKLLDEVLHSNAHEHQVTWLQKFQVVEAGPIGVSGDIRYQICETGKTCMSPLKVPFSLGSQQQPGDVAGAQPIVQSFAHLTSESAPPKKGADSLPAFSVKTEGGDLSFAGAFLAAFLAGLIMNILPCVLPVLAIKILSLVQQAGESRGRIISLNLAYTAGVMSVFMGFAFLSWGLGQSLSSVFQNETFMIVMACVVFLMGLSLFGIFELPVPGIIPSAGHHQEGYAGAFNTGIIATVLGTPCIGPFIAPVFTWSLTQPTVVVFSMFGMMGLGMASPFLLTGLIPSLVNWLPRPGDWMVKFKQFTGFILMGTVIWLLVSIDLAWRVPVLVLLLSLALLVWMSANLAQHHDPRWKKLRAGLAGLVTAAPIFLFGLWMMREFPPGGATEMHLSRMPWQAFSEEQLVKLRNEGRPMLIDFTANWCVICKINEKIALDRDDTVRFVEENGFVPMLADFTKDNPEILKWLREFGQESVPLTIIVPPGVGSEIIALRGQYSQATLLEKLRTAVEKPPTATATTRPAELRAAM